MHSIDDLLPHAPLHCAATGEMVKGSYYYIITIRVPLIQVYNSSIIRKGGESGERDKCNIIISSAHKFQIGSTYTYAAIRKYQSSISIITIMDSWGVATKNSLVRLLRSGSNRSMRNAARAWVCISLK